VWGNDGDAGVPPDAAIGNQARPKFLHEPTGNRAGIYTWPRFPAPIPWIFSDGFDTGGNGGGTVILAQTTDSTPVSQNSVACSDSAYGTTADNHYWRRYSFSDYAVASAASVTSMDISVQQTTAAPTLTVTLYTIPHSVVVDTIDLVQLRQIGLATLAAPSNAALTSVNVPVAGTVADTVGSDLVVDVSTDNRSVNGTAFCIGSTPSAETHPGLPQLDRMRAFDSDSHRRRRFPEHAHHPGRQHH